MASGSFLGPPAPLATKPSFSQSFSSVSDALTSPRGSSTALSMSVHGLDALQDVFEAVNTLPCIKYIAGISIKVLEIIQEVQLTNEMVRKISMRARDIVLAVARSCADSPEEIMGQLESDLQQLTETMSDILEFTQEIATRKAYRKILNKSEDAAAAKSLDAQLTHAFQIFEIQSSVSLRISQQQMVRQLSDMSIASHQSLISNCPLRVVEGLYIIRNVADGRVIETEHRRPAPSYLHACVAPSNDGFSQYQVWVVAANKGTNNDYIISNFATGASLDVFCGHTQEGTQVICQSTHGGPNQTWSFYGSRTGHLFDFCTIRSHGPPTILDGQCPAETNCDYLHMTCLRDVYNARASQEWSLVRLPFSVMRSQPSAGLSMPSASGITLPRRRFILQNAASGCFATVVASNGRTSNVRLQNDLKAASSWHFEHTVLDNGQYDDMFAIVTSARPDGRCSLDHYGSRHIAANPGTYHPKDQFHMWKAIPRDGAFCFRNLATGRLLSQSSTSPVADTAAATLFNNTACQWRLVDATTGAVCPTLYDSALAIPPPELAGSLSASIQPQFISAEPMLRTETASATMCRLFADGFKREHNMIREMLNSGYTSLVLAPRLITGWKVGVGIHDVTMRDEDLAFGLPKFRGKKSFDTCNPR